VSRDVTTPLSGTVCRPLAGTSYDQPVHQLWSLLSRSCAKRPACECVTRGYRAPEATVPSLPSVNQNDPRAIVMVMAASFGKQPSI